jgi:chemotaxis protein MotB
MARRRKPRVATEAGHIDERWLVTYADMLTLLLAVFIVMYALSDTNVRKFTAFAQSIAAAFSTDVFEGSAPSSIAGGEVTAPGSGTFQAGQGIVSADLRAVRAAVRDYVITQGSTGTIDVEQVPEGIAIRISEGMLFHSGRAVLTDDSRQVLMRVAQVVGGLPNPLRIEGHTDDVPPDGVLYADNWELSTARAIAVLRGLSAAGVQPDRLSAAGFAQYRPMSAGTTEAERARNRRVDILILYPDVSGSAASEAPTDDGKPFHLP